MKKFATVTVIGKDKTGVIARVTNFLFEQHANIEALEEQVTRGQFSMTLQASWKPSQLNEAQVNAGLERLARELQMEIRLRFAHPQRRQRMAILVTREPHCLEEIMRAFRRGRPPSVSSAARRTRHSDLRADPARWRAAPAGTRRARPTCARRRGRG